METFLTILAWVFLVLCALRIVGIYFGAKEQASLIRLAEITGADPIGDALKAPVITAIICLSWIISAWL